jgi:hypothetical protein
MKRPGILTWLLANSAAVLGWWALCGWSAFVYFTGGYLAAPGAVALFTFIGSIWAMGAHQHLNDYLQYRETMREIDRQSGTPNPHSTFLEAMLDGVGLKIVSFAILSIGSGFALLVMGRGGPAFGLDPAQILVLVPVLFVGLVLVFIVAPATQRIGAHSKAVRQKSQTGAAALDAAAVTLAAFGLLYPNAENPLFTEPWFYLAIFSGFGLADRIVRGVRISMGWNKPALAKGQIPVNSLGQPVQATVSQVLKVEGSKVTRQSSFKAMPRFCLEMIQQERQGR